jgi:hypothetical protein
MERHLTALIIFQNIIAKMDDEANLSDHLVGHDQSRRASVRPLIVDFFEFNLIEI